MYYHMHAYGRPGKFPRYIRRYPIEDNSVIGTPQHEQARVFLG